MLQEAQQAAVASARSGVSAQHVDGVARKIIEDAGYGPYFVHRTGHGIGIEEHEDPYLVVGNEECLEPGHAFSVEPGIYLPERFGMRLEDIVVIGEDGAPDPLNSADHGPWSSSTSRRARMDLGIEGRAALVVAGSRGLGRATAEALAGEGRPGLCCRPASEAGLDAAASAMRSAGAQVATRAADITDPAAPAQLVAATLEAFGAIDIVIANAGGPPAARALDLDDASWRRPSTPTCSPPSG